MVTFHKNIEEINSIIDSHPLIGIDKTIVALQNLKSLNVNKAQQLYKTLAKGVVIHLNLTTENDHIQTIFRKDLNYSSKEFIGIILLRALNANPNIFTSCKEIYHRSFSIFDNCFFDIYKELKINKKDQTYIKVSKLGEHIKLIEENINNHIKDVSDLALFDSFERAYRKTILNKRIIQIINYFVPNELINDSKLNEIFTLIRYYLKSEHEEQKKSFEKVTYALKNFIEISSEFGTKYSIDYLSKPFEKILSLINSEFSDSPYGKPANLKLASFDKKYPFRNLDNPFKVRFILENTGEGYAYNIIVKIIKYDKEIFFKKDKIEFREIKNTSIIIDFESEIKEQTDQVNVECGLYWENYNNSSGETIFNFTLVGQKTDTDWDSMKYEDPFSPEPVETEDKLIGRNEILNRMFAKTKGQNISSFFIHGQKRVGKTSIAKTFKSKIQNTFQNDFIVLYIETGEYQTTTASVEKTINNLGEKICNQIKSKESRFKSLIIPHFEGSFSSINDFLDQISMIAPNCKILIILDEFDEINSQLYRRGEIGDSFFLTLRAISNKSKFGFILVGGEKMNLIISCQGEQINKFQTIRLDYFDKENFFTDFKELVRNPVPYLEINDKSIDLIHDYSGGNPYYTKIICDNMFNLAVERRDNYVSESEMQEAINHSLTQAEPNSFAHFWDDGIEEKADKEEIISMNRRKVFLAIAEVLNKHNLLKENYIIDAAVNKNIQEDVAEGILKELIERKILFEKDGIYKFVVKYFAEWLKHYGLTKIITTFSDIEKINERKRQEKQAKIKSEEISQLVDKWEPYQGKEITTDKIRRWLDQFGENTTQRLMFHILQNIRFYTNYNARVQMQDLNKRILRDLSVKGYRREVVDTTAKTGKELARLKRKDFIISYLDNIGKSGAEYAKIFADENQIYSEMIIEKSKINYSINKNKNIRAIVFIDDFIGTGNSITENFQELFENQPEIFNNENLSIYIGVVCGFQGAKDKIVEFISNLGVDVKIFLCDLLNDSDKCFSEESKVFKNINDKLTAKNICYEKGANLVNYNELGFGDCQATVVFYNNCPNNSLPILWKRTKHWIPLFERK